ncbi:dTMP kinase [Candidatus Micrarchaeota archaeon]|nr:dTMP kinase [Candidatus Micrarchaeota archaeon]
MKGKLIVLEGVDASGKHTQALLLKKNLDKEGYGTEIIAFPTYDTSMGSLVKKYLHGEFGDLESLPPEIPAMLYAADRMQHKQAIQNRLSAGKILIADRYVQSNLYQAAKIQGEQSQGAFIQWLKQLEASLPAADQVIFFNVPTSHARKLMELRGRKPDLHEQDEAFLERVRQLYLKEAKRLNWIVIDGFQGNALRSKEDIAEDVLRVVKPVLTNKKT